jgi:hypothetical protein
MRLLQTTFIALFGLFAGAAYSDQVWKGEFSSTAHNWNCCSWCTFEPVKGNLTLTIMDNAPQKAKLSLTYVGDYECGTTKTTTIIISEINQNAKAHELNFEFAFGHQKIKFNATNFKFEESISGNYFSEWPYDEGDFYLMLNKKHN